MYGIVDFEEEISKLQPEELAPHLSTEIGRIPWPQERAEFLPKPLKHRPFVYEGDYLSDRLVEQQEQAQALLFGLKNKFKSVSKVYSEAINRVEDRLDDKDLLPTLGLGTLAGLISWRSNLASPLPLKALFTLTGVFASSLLTHQKLRDTLIERAGEIIPAGFKEHYRVVVDERIGMFGASVWNSCEESFYRLKARIFQE